MNRALKFERLERRNLLSVVPLTHQGFSFDWTPDQGYWVQTFSGCRGFTHLKLWETAPGFGRGRD
jgi:hypothetical protein